VRVKHIKNEEYKESQKEQKKCCTWPTNESSYEMDTLRENQATAALWVAYSMVDLTTTIPDGVP